MRCYENKWFYMKYIQRRWRKRNHFCPHNYTSIFSDLFQFILDLHTHFKYVKKNYPMKSISIHANQTRISLLIIKSRDTSNGKIGHFLAYYSNWYYLLLLAFAGNSFVFLILDNISTSVWLWIQVSSGQHGQFSRASWVLFGTPRPPVRD